MKWRVALPLLLSLLTACAGWPYPSPSDMTPADVSCPSSFEEAQAGSFDESMFVGAGHVIRFVPSPDREYRGYDINITRPLTPGAPFMDVGFLRIDDPLPGIAPGDAVLLVAARTERNHRLFTPGPCVPLVGIPESFVEP
ncbi:MAG TPA: hypothetical protein VHR55_05845 [Candidatus Limnocylindria bacterium]|nr:hypothetical protein [Candidatus Limnocylindria bacterium]